MEKYLAHFIISAVALASLGLCWHFIRQMISGYKEDAGKSRDKIWEEISFIKSNYVEGEKHVLLCQNNALLLEQTFKKCLEEHKNAIFEHMREQKEAIEKGMGEIKKKISIKDN